MTALMGTGCTKEPSIADHLTDTEFWRLTDHCFEYGFVNFRPDGSGNLYVDDECEVGYSCTNVMPFDWSVDEGTGRLTLIYSASGNALVLCGVTQQTAPPAEVTVVSTETTLISLQGYLFRN